MGKWANDASNWNQKWEIIDGAICLKNIPAEPETEENIPWFAVEPKEEDSTPRNSKAPLWSPPIRKSTGMRCITMDYKVYVDSDELEGYSLTVLQQQDGIPSNSVSVFMIVDVSSVFHVWAFNNDLEYWTNDDEIGNQKWFPTPSLQSVCLSAKPPSSFLNDPRKPAWMAEEEELIKTPTSTKARLRSPKIPGKVNMQCLAIIYGIFPGSDDVDDAFIPGPSLSILERRDRCLNLLFFPETWFPSRLYPPKLLLTWSFTEDLEDWTNDGDNWLIKWKSTKINKENMICLSAKAPQRNRQSLLLTEVDIFTKTGIQARLLSPLIPARLNMRCLSLTYSFDSGSDREISGSFSLAEFRPPKSPLDCNFDGSSNWMPDPRDSSAKWQIENDTMCLRPVILSSTSLAFISSNPSARVWSSDIPFVLNIRCLRFDYFLSPIDEISLSVQLHSSGYEMGAL
ncbi:unnamed protein product [Hymenolepis diminuta]|uniref:MAM domain-containing protein n=1 Tax=Hymenolepis diminuta TaxID=6216 RepID=A0A564Z1C7_HYMDI|nr:unnamed protein product [Hymenolepis diminuta]